MNIMRTVVLLVVAIFFSDFVSETSAKSPLVRAVVTIYNRTSVHLDYQLRVLRNDSISEEGPKWSDWKTRHHAHPNGGYMWHSFIAGNNIEKIEIRFDRIGGDDIFTEKKYNLPFNVVRKFEDIMERDGRPYCFRFDAGGRLLDLKTGRR